MWICRRCKPSCFEQRCIVCSHFGLSSLRTKHGRWCSELIWIGSIYATNVSHACNNGCVCSNCRENVNACWTRTITYSFGILRDSDQIHYFVKECMPWSIVTLSGPDSDIYDVPEGNLPLITNRFNASIQSIWNEANPNNGTTAH